MFSLYVNRAVHVWVTHWNFWNVSIAFQCVDLRMFSENSPKEQQLERLLHSTHSVEGNNLPFTHYSLEGSREKQPSVQLMCLPTSDKTICSYALCSTWLNNIYWLCFNLKITVCCKTGYYGVKQTKKINEVNLQYNLVLRIQKHQWKKWEINSELWQSCP